MPAGPRRLFIYYRVAAPHVEAVTAALGPVMTALQQRHPGLQTALLRRPDIDDQGLCTLMETYRFDGSPGAAAQGIEWALQAEIESLVWQTVSAWVIGSRHTEVFVEQPLPPCAS